MKNINKIILIFGIVLVFLIGSFLFVSAETFDSNNEDNKMSLKEWLSNLFEGEYSRISGGVVDEESLNKIEPSELKLPEDSNIKGIEIQDSVEYFKEEGLIIFTGSGKLRTEVAQKNQIGKVYEYSLGEDGSLKIDSLTGEIVEGRNFKPENKFFNLGQSLDASENVRGFPEGAEIISFSKNNGEISFKFPETGAGNYHGQIFKITGGQNFDFSKFKISFNNLGEIQILNFDATSETSLEIFNGRFSFDDGGKVSMANNLLESSKIFIEKIPSIPEGLKFQTFVEGRQYEVNGIAINSEEIVFKEGTLKNFGFDEEDGEGIFRGFIVIDEKGYISVPASKEVEVYGGYKINFPEVEEGVNKPGISESVYIFGDEEIAKSSGKNNYVADKYLEELDDFAFVINNGGKGIKGDSFEVSWTPELLIEGNLEADARLSFLADETKTGYAIIYPEEWDAMSGKLLENYAEIYGEGISFGDDGNDYFWKDGKYISVHDSKKEYSENPGVNMHVITKLAPDDAETVGVLITNQGKTSYFDTTTKTTDEFEAEYKKIGRKAILKENPILSRQSLVEGRVRKDTSRFLENPRAEAVAKEMTNNIREIQKFQRENLEKWRQNIGEETYQKIFVSVDSNDPNKLEKAITEEINKKNKNLYLTSDKTANYQQYENALLTYQNNRDNLIGAGIIDPKDSSFPDYFGLEEEKEIYKIMQNQNLDHEQATKQYLQKNDLLIGPRALFRSPNFNTLSVWKTNYGAKDIREEFQKVLE